MILQWRKIIIEKAGISSFSCYWGFYVTSKQGIVFAEVVLKGFWTLCGNLWLYTSGLICSVDGKHLSKHSKSWVSFTERCQNVVMGCRCDETMRRMDVLEIGCEIFRTWSWLTLCSMRSFLTCMMSSIGNLIYHNALQLLFMVASRINLVHGFSNLKSLFRCSKK